MSSLNSWCAYYYDFELYLLQKDGIDTAGIVAQAQSRIAMHGAFMYIQEGFALVGAVTLMLLEPAPMLVSMDGLIHRLDLWLDR